MKKTLLFSLAGLSVLTFSCRNVDRAGVVTETFIHKYGVPIARSDWTLNGKNGQVVQLKTDGITVSRSYEKGILSGPTTYTFPNSSTIHRVENYDHGTLISEQENYPSGVPCREEKFESEQLAQSTSWYEDGTPAALEYYKNGLIESGEYRTPLNVVESRVQQGIGTRICRSSTGEMLSKDTIQTGQLVERVAFHPSGEPASVTPYESGLVHGLRLTFLPGGLPNTVEQWVHGKQEGSTIVYQNGEKVSEVLYRKGLKHGVEYRYRNGNTLVEEVTWRNGIQHGPHKIIADEVEKTEWYHQGEVVSRTTYERMNRIR